MKGVEDSNVERAMHFLAETDVLYAEAKVGVERAEIFRKRVRSRLFITGTGTVAERQAQAETHSEAESADCDYLEALKVFEELKAKRQRAELVIDLYRTVEASRRKAA